MIVQLILTVILLTTRSEARNQGCSILMMVDDSVTLDDEGLRQKIDFYVKDLNRIYQNTILKDPPNDDLYFYVKKVINLQRFLPNCQNKQVK